MNTAMTSYDAASASLPRDKVLMFSYWFPPLGGSGVQRTLKFVKYLPLRGFDSLVVAGQPRWFSQVPDAGLTREIPPTAVVVRVPTIPFDYVQGKLDGLLRRLGISTDVIMSALWPDPVVGWVPAAVREGFRLIRRHQPRVLYSTSLPASSHLAALIVHRMTGLPWVADFRDGLTYHPDPSYTRAHPPTRVTAALERRVVRAAKFTTVACESIDIVDLARDDPRRRMIPNGVDLDDLPVDRTMSAGTDDRFRLTFVGTMFGARDGGPVLAAVRALVDRGVIDPGRFEVRIVGNVMQTDRGSLPVPVSFTGFVDHAQAVVEMHRATALIFHEPPYVPGASGKVYEYLASRRPVICAAHPNNVGYRLIDELGAGECADVRDQAAVEAALERLVLRWKQGALTPLDHVRDEALRRFSRAKLAGDLAEVLRAAVGEADTPAHSRAAA
jgi:glycosyltransferase involved in cell wall biosynthesis